MFTVTTSDGTELMSGSHILVEKLKEEPNFFITNTRKTYTIIVQNLNNTLLVLTDIKNNEATEEQAWLPPEANNTIEFELYEQDGENLILVDSISVIVDEDDRFCDCVIKVAAKNTRECLKHRENWGKKGCYNPYAVCSKSIGTTSRKCGKLYEKQNYNMDHNELLAYANLIDPNNNFSDSTSRDEIIRNIQEVKKVRYSE